MNLNTDPADAIGNLRLIDLIYQKAGLKRRGLRSDLVSSTTMHPSPDQA
jgi:hypothetical protein